MTKLGGLLALLLAILATSVQAALIRLDFTGTISVSNTVFGITPNVGDPVTGTLFYDSAVSPFVNPPDIALYSQPHSFSINVGGHTFSAFEPLYALTIGNNTLGGQEDLFQAQNGVSFGPSFGTMAVDGIAQPNGSMEFILTDFTQTVFSSTAMPTSIDFTQFTNSEGDINQFFPASSGSNQVAYIVNSVTTSQIPEPRSLSLAVISVVGGVLVFRMRRRTKPCAMHQLPS